MHIIGRLGDRLLAVLVPTVTAHAAPCQCEGVWAREVVCFCNPGNHRQWQKRRRCDGCNIIEGSCREMNVSC